MILSNKANKPNPNGLLEEFKEPKELKASQMLVDQEEIVNGLSNKGAKEEKSNLNVKVEGWANQAKKKWKRMARE